MKTYGLTEDEVNALISILEDKPNVLRDRNYPMPEEGEFYDVISVLLQKLKDEDDF